MEERETEEEERERKREERSIETMNRQIDIVIHFRLLAPIHKAVDANVFTPF